MILQPPLGRAVYLGVARDLSGAASQFALPPGVIARAATEQDFPRLVAFMQRPDFRGKRLRLIDLQRRYERGDRCVLGEHHDEIIGLGWVRFDSAAYPLAGIDVPLRRGEAYVGAIFVTPQLRGRGALTGGSLVAYHWLREHGVVTGYGWVQPANRPMVRTMLRLGWNIKAQVTQYFVWLGVRLPAVNIVQVSDPADPLCQWCSPQRIRFRCGLRIFRQGPIALPPAGTHRGASTAAGAGKAARLPTGRGARSGAPSADED